MNALRKSETDDTDEYFSLPVAAAEVDKARQTVLGLIAQGVLEGKTVAGRVVITKESVRKYQTENGITPGGRRKRAPRRRKSRN